MPICETCQSIASAIVDCPRESIELGLRRWHGRNSRCPYTEAFASSHSIADITIGIFILKLHWFYPTHTHTHTFHCVLFTCVNELQWIYLEWRHKNGNNIVDCKIPRKMAWIVWIVCANYFPFFPPSTPRLERLNLITIIVITGKWISPINQTMTTWLTFKTFSFKWMVSYAYITHTHTHPARFIHTL